ncbi:MAG: recombinase family protein [Chloroflexi bacterium]|nr:recombinase family protein [Chloroflexota bacterium]
MLRRYKPLPSESTGYSDGISSPPLDKPVAVYYRQSTEPQVGNISTFIQTVDMPNLLRKRGWADDKIIVIDTDEGVSGQKRIEERAGMSRLFDLIVSRQIGTVAAQDEDRLFRDQTQIQVNTFIHACKQAYVYVLTPSVVYDFAHPQMGDFYQRQFRYKCEMAADYIKSVIQGRLHGSIRRLRMEGRWAGQTMPPGFMVDMRKTLTDGTKNENWRRFVEFAPYSEVMNEYFKVFLEHAGNVRATVRHILQHGPWFPEPRQCIPPEGYKIVYGMRHLDGRYCPTRLGLLKLLTNVTYIGHWAVNSVVVRWNNHPAIVPVETFMRAFNYLCQYSIDGTPNKDYTPAFDHARPSREVGRGVERPLLSGMLYSQHLMGSGTGSARIGPANGTTTHINSLIPALRQDVFGQRTLHMWTKPSSGFFGKSCRPHLIHRNGGRRLNPLPRMPK